MKIKDIISTLQQYDNQEDEVLEIRTGIYGDCIIVDFEDESRNPLRIDKPDNSKQI